MSVPPHLQLLLRNMGSSAVTLKMVSHPADQPESSVNPQSEDVVWVLRMGVAHPKLLVLLKSHVQIQI